MTFGQNIIENGSGWLSAILGGGLLLALQNALSPENRALRRIERLARIFQTLPKGASASTFERVLHSELARYAKLRANRVNRWTRRLLVVTASVLLLAIGTVVAGIFSWLDQRVLETAYGWLLLAFLVLCGVTMVFSSRAYKASEPNRDAPTSSEQDPPSHAETDE